LFRWLPGGFPLEQRARIDFAELPIEALGVEALWGIGAE
jgi:hypothetical protein